MQNAPREHSAIDLFFIKPPFVINTFCLFLSGHFAQVFLYYLVKYVLGLYHSHPYLMKGEHSGSVVERLTGDRGPAGSSLTGITVLCP